MNVNYPSTIAIKIVTAQMELGYQGDGKECTGIKQNILS